MATLYAQPSDPAVIGFYFQSAAEFSDLRRKLRGADGAAIRDFEFRFADGPPLDAELFEAIGVGPAELGLFFDVVRRWTVDQKRHVVVAVRHAGARFPLNEGEADEIDIDLHRVDSLRELAVKFVEDGIFGKVSKEASMYLDYDAIARDLEKAYSMVAVAGRRFAFSIGKGKTVQV